MITYQAFTNYYGGIKTREAALEYAERETQSEWKAMFVRLAEELEQGVMYVSFTNENGKLAYRKV